MLCQVIRVLQIPGTSLRRGKHLALYPLISSPDFGSGRVQKTSDGLPFGWLRGFSVRLLGSRRAAPRCPLRYPLHPPASSFLSCVAAFLPFFSSVRLPSVVSLLRINIEGFPKSPPKNIYLYKAQKRRHPHRVPPSNRDPPVTTVSLR